MIRQPSIMAGAATSCEGLSTPETGRVTSKQGRYPLVVQSSLEALLGNKTAAMLMLYLFHYGEAYPTGAARDLGLSQSPVQRQLEKFESAGLLVSKLVGRTRIYTFNPKHPATQRLRELVRVFYEGMSLREREQMFGTRRRPRRRGKPVRDR